jgi:hypothetical protein
VRAERTQAGTVFASVRALNVWLVAAWILYYAPMVEWLTEGRGSDVWNPLPLSSTVLTGKAADFYSVCALFESHPRHRIS